MRFLARQNQAVELIRSTNTRIQPALLSSPFPRPSLSARRRRKSSGSHAYRVRNWIWENEKMVWGESRRKSVRTHRRGDEKIKANLPEGNEKARGTD
ncbi:hypothetical protein RSAG8_07360, partial [Rhizoctonia solani AG-8 WAC10335]